MRREMQQLAALVEAAAAGEAWAAEDAPPGLDERVITQQLLAPSRNLLPALALILLGGVGFALGGWPLMLLAPGVAARAFGRGFTAWSWRWCEDRARRELQVVLPRFARARLQHFQGGVERLGGLARYAPSGIALAQGAPVLLLVSQGRAARIPFSLIQGWAWQAAGQSASGGDPPPRPSSPGLCVALAGVRSTPWHFACDDPSLLRLWGARLSA